MRSRIKLLFVLFLAVGVAFITSCSRDAVEEPSPLGPSGFAISLKVSASPNVLFAGFQNRESTVITADLKRYDGTPLSGRTVHFELRDSLTNARADGIGYFDGFRSAASEVTNGNGTVAVSYYGPTTGELRKKETIENNNFYIAAYVAWEGSEFIFEYVPIYFVRDFSDLIFNVKVDPNVLWCNDTRPESTIKAYYAGPDGAPMVGRKIFFKIISGQGYFSDGKTKTFKEADSSGYATMIYKGPTKSEMTMDEEFVTIQVQPETWWDEFGDYPPGQPDDDRYYIHVEFRIRLKRAG